MTTYASPIEPLQAGIGLRAPHMAEFVQTQPAVGFVEVHSENFFGPGGKPLHLLGLVRRDHALSLHGVGLSLGSTDPLDDDHLRALRDLIRAFEPALVSDHLCWSSIGGVFSNDLLPLPYTDESLDHVVRRVQQVQDKLARRILIENPSSYLRYAHSTIPEWQFLVEVARRAGCGILLDINNIHVSAHNLGFDPLAYVHGVPAALVDEIHLAGFAQKHLRNGAQILIDTHGAPVDDAVWSLYATAIERFGPVPTLIEWDTDLPPLARLLDEARKANAVLAQPVEACAA
jgi:uncharacterized protein